MDCNQQILCFTLLMACAIVCQAGNVQLKATSENVEEHDKVTLTCSTSAAADGLTWSRSGEDVDVEDQLFEYELSQKDGKWEGKLTILSMEHENEGNYTCSANGLTSNAVFITAVHHIHHVTTSRPIVLLTAGSALTLTCQADIHTEVVWLKDLSTQLLNGEHDVTITVNKDESNHLLTSTLKINSANDHTGTYTCQSAHMHDHDEEDKATISVKLGVEALSDTSSAVTYALQLAPSTSFKALLCGALATSLLFSLNA